MRGEPAVPHRLVATDLKIRIFFGKQRIERLAGFVLAAACDQRIHHRIWRQGFLIPQIHAFLGLVA